MPPAINPESYKIKPGRAYPLGAMVRESGVRFSLVSRHARRVWLALFNDVDDDHAAHEIEFDSKHHRTGDIWSIFVQGIAKDTLYAFRLDGPFEPERGHRYDPSHYLLDPAAKLILGDIPSGKGKCVVVDEEEDWADDIKPHTPMSETIIYETHVRGMTRHESSGVEHPGSYLGLIEKLPYLKELGITAIELLPIQECGEESLGRCSLVTGEELVNYWGYNSIGFFAPMGRYAAERGQQVEEFRRLVAACHDHGLEVIIDVVFNHTAEGNEKGPTLCFRGIDNAIYYLLNGKGEYKNFSGCGNTMNCNHPNVRSFILDSLRYWVTAMHVDGFRFDLASILGRDQKGHVVHNAPLVEHIAEDPVLRDVKLIAEAWDAGGAYQVGSFGTDRWAEWNGRYRDEVRCFWRGDRGARGLFATRLTGSADLYEWEGRTPTHSINFVTAHDGFPLRDLVSYNEKHNWANGENNRDGMDYNCSWNCGVEGETDEPAINQLRLRMQKNFCATLLLSLGVPMILGGDEFGRSQQGNNNAYCQDNAISWFDWNQLEKNRDLFRFFKELVILRKTYPVFRRNHYFAGREKSTRLADILWFDSRGKEPQWDKDDRCLACWMSPRENAGTSVYMLFNPTEEIIHFKLGRQRNWKVRVNTAADSPNDVRRSDEADVVEGLRVEVSSHSMMVLMAD